MIGTGYLGATHAAAMAELGHEVLGVDTDSAKIAALSTAQLPFFEPGLPELLHKNIECERLHFNTNYDRAAEFAQFHFIGVGTPQLKGSFAADTTYVGQAVSELARRVQGHHTVVGKSTVPVGTAEEVQKLADDILGERGLDPIEHSLTVVWNPEFLREGKAVDDSLQPDRIVLGLPGAGRGAGVELAKERFHECFAEVINRGTPLITTDLATAELVKVTANAFLATKISFINAVSEICEVAGADVTTVADAIGMDQRIGRHFLNAGLGFGGGCLPKDIRAFMARAGELGVDQALTFLREVDAINMRRREKTVELVKQQSGGSVLGSTVAVLGAAFKPNSDDVRDSPALSIAGALSLAGASVQVYDPEAMENAKKVFPTLAYSSSIEDALAGADVVVVATEWQQFQQIDPSEAAELVRHQVVVDGRNCLPLDRWEAAGWKVTCLGRG